MRAEWVVVLLLAGVASCGGGTPAPGEPVPGSVLISR